MGQFEQETDPPAQKDLMAEDAGDLAVFGERANETPIRFSEVIEDLKRRGKL